MDYCQSCCCYLSLKDKQHWWPASPVQWLQQKKCVVSDPSFRVCGNVNVIHPAMLRKVNYIYTRYTYMQEMPHAQGTDEGGTLHGAC